VKIVREGIYMRKEHVVKPLKYKSLPGLSERQLGEHHDVLYAGYVKKLNEIEAKLESVDRTDANGTFSVIGELKRAEGFATNALNLHEGYFDNLGGKENKPTGKIMELIKEDFGSWEKWEEDFKASGVAARGWVVLAFNWYDKKLHNYSTDYHTQGIWNATPILVLDVYEHAYFLDYATARKKYIEAFMQNIDWKQVNDRAMHYELEKHRK